MSSSPDAIARGASPGVDARAATGGRARPFLWLVRREMWEHRSIRRVPIVVAGLALLAFLLGSARIASMPAPFAGMEATQAAALLARPYAFVALSVLMSALLVAARALGPVHERRLLGRTALLFDGADRGLLAGLGELRTPGLADLFVALVGGQGTSAHAQEAVAA